MSYSVEFADFLFFSPLPKNNNKLKVFNLSFCRTENFNTSIIPSPPSMNSIGYYVAKKRFLEHKEFSSVCEVSRKCNSTNARCLQKYRESDIWSSKIRSEESLPPLSISISIYDNPPGIPTL